MTLKTYREAIIEAMILEMKRDEKVFVIGEDISWPVPISFKLSFT